MAKATVSTLPGRSRFFDLMHETGDNLSLIKGYQQLTQPLLEEAIIHIQQHKAFNIDAHIQNKVSLAKKVRSEGNDINNLTVDESAAIQLYTMESKTERESLFYVLNSTLRLADRSELKPILLYLRLLIGALEKLPSFNGLIYRGVNGDVNRVKQLLQTATLNEINLVGLDGSTPLHVACRQGHQKIVELLLEQGAVRRIKNQNQLTPVDETSNQRIKESFQRPQVACQQRYVTTDPHIEWTFAAPSVAYTNRLGHLRPCDLESVVNEFMHTKELKRCERRNLIDWLCTKAQETKDPIYLLELYTAETGFYKILNHTMAKNEAYLKHAEVIMPWAVYFAGMLFRNSFPEPYRYQGQTHRGMRINKKDLRAYKIAEIFSGWNDDPTDRSTFPVLCIYKIIDRQSSIDLEEVSEFPDEEEVLIMSSTAFRVVNIQKHSHHSKYEIELEEETDPNKNVPVIPLPKYPAWWQRNVQE
ncbi:unnamed protein product [Rotaria sp. Silwood1]|nr:unnamed protein product [Rotaria sp. Silwood1]CAF4521374.1 unnamed protein product [Rotaria sp. Silwood1]